MRQEALVRLLVAVVCGAALVLIVVIAGGSEIDDTGGRAIATAAAVAFFSLTGVAGSTLAARRPDLRLLGHLTTAVSTLALLIFVVSVWGGSFVEDDHWRPAAYSGILAFALGHASLLLTAARAGETDAVRAARAWTLAALSLLVVLVFVEISQPGRDVGAQAIAVVAVLYVLGVVLIPLLRRGAGASARGAHATAGERGAVGLDHAVIAVSDWTRSHTFYRDVLGAEIVPLHGDRIAYRFGAQQLNPHGPGSEAAPLAADPVRPGGSDICLRWPDSAEAALAHLRAHGVEVLAGPLEREGAAGRGRSVYCRDPDGSLVELISYE